MHRTLHASIKSSGIRAVRLRTSIWQTTMMASDCKCRKGLTALIAFKSSCGCMIYPVRVSVYAFLKFLRIFSDIMHSSDQFTLIVCLK